MDHLPRLAVEHDCVLYSSPCPVRRATTPPLDFRDAFHAGDLPGRRPARHTGGPRDRPAGTQARRRPPRPASSPGAVDRVGCAIARPLPAVDLVPRLLGGRGTPGRERDARAAAAHARRAVPLHAFQPLGRVPGPQAPGGRGRLSPLRPAGLGGASARRAAPVAARLRQARSLARARHPGGQPRHPGGHGGRHGQPRQRPAQLAGEDRAARRLPGSRPGRGRLR